MFAVIVNTVAVIIGSLIGMGLKKGIPEKVSRAILKGIGLCTIVIGIQGAVKEDNILLLIISIAVGIAIGEWINIDGNLDRFTKAIIRRISKRGTESANISQNMINAFLITSVGAMTIVGSLDAGLRHDFNMLYTKSLLDFITCIMLAAALGVGVLLSAILTFVVQAAIVLLAQYLAPYLSDGLILELTCVGSVMIIAIGLNMLGLTKLKVLNFLPAFIIVPFAMLILRQFGF